MAKTDYDYLIVGQGIAGTSLGMHLVEAGKSFQIIGDSSLPSSSKVAAGIFNPLTGKKLVKTWLADDLFPYARNFYSTLEKKFSCQLVHEMPIYRPFRSIEEQNTYLAQTADPKIAPYISQNEVPADVSDYIHAGHGGIEVIQAGWIDLPKLLVESRRFFSENNQFVEARFYMDDVRISEFGVIWNNKIFSKIIFCQGFMALENQLFDWLPFTPVKGQILKVSTETHLKPYIINQGIFMLPDSESTMRVGATYSWDPLDWEPTQEATEELDGKLRSIFKCKYTIKTGIAGIRPSVKDRRPLIGLHPKHRNVGIFNGLGTKGVTLAPFFANQFVGHLESGKELNPAVNIDRYFSLYFR
ncbi:FAD-binding oxidoreductase [Dyadobacter sp. CY323]|uniref:NAD(P)/FAD-dependent oxidoreductase n=1 Tax=Dyadobacter sp. CY323 TaxID=2907302 RepID=UPI001F36F31B|nr:FAD-dependent oxidoreductase [Dyadobacter sp. CY323]MCE6992903.1 FAD-binding oxidoreductase [Dyadobacter sp. CY323]